MQFKFKAVIGRMAFLGGIAGATIMPSYAAAQAAPELATAPVSTAGAVGADGESLTEIVVTGTSLRGVAPAGAEAFSLDTRRFRRLAHSARTSCWRKFRS